MKKVGDSKALSFYILEPHEEFTIPFFETKVRAGFPSPAADFISEGIDLNKQLVRNRAATYCVRVEGDSMVGAGLNDGDVLIVDKSIEPENGKIAICSIDGEFTIKRIKKEKDHILLLPANNDYNPIKVNEDNDFIVWGIVAYVIKKVI